jgi:hypothetical protein
MSLPRFRLLSSCGFPFDPQAPPPRLRRPRFVPALFCAAAELSAAEFCTEELT